MPARSDNMRSAGRSFAKNAAAREMKMRKGLKSLTFIIQAASAAATGAWAGDAAPVRLAIASAATGQHVQISVDGSNGRYDRIATENLPVVLALSAELEPGGGADKILTSELFLKMQGRGQSAVAVDASGPPVKRIGTQQSAVFAIEPQGPVAQAALALCNSERGAQRQTLSMSLPIVWRVTTGRFRFQWTNYDRVAPTADIQNNRDFYADQATTEAETVFAAAVVCQPLAGVAPVAVATPTSSVRQVALMPADSKAGHDANPTPGNRATATATALSKPRCDGGMIRQIGARGEAYACLCPGNTTRVEIAGNAFRCQRASARR
jgi:hypothetical protein